MSVIQTRRTFVDAIVDRFLIRSIDKPFLICLFKCSSLFISGLAIFMLPNYALYLFPVHLAIYGYFLGAFITMFHDINHHPLFKNKKANTYIIGVFGLIYGMTPHTYYCHHIIMHHPEDNGYKDLSTTRPFRRDSMKDFLSYYRGFLFSLFSLANYLKKSNNKQCRQHAREMLFSELIYVLIAVVLLFIHPIAAIATLVLPTFLTRSFLILGNWAEHAFIDSQDPSNVYKNTTNILGKCNEVWFNVGYHIGHHLKPRLHFSLLEKDFQDNIERYAEEDAIVFDGVHYPHIWYYLMTKNYEKLADLYVHLPRQKKRTRAEVIELLKSRVVAIPEVN